MKEIYLLFTGDYYSISGGYIYNRKLVENLKPLGIEVKLVQISEKHVPDSPGSTENLELILSKIPTGSILLIDSLAFGSNHTLWKKYYHSQTLVPLIHLPLFLNIDFSSDFMIKEKELEALSFARHVIVTSSFTKLAFEKEGVPVNKISVINPGVEVLTKKQQYPLIPEQLLCVSNINRSKNQILLLKVLTRLKHFDWILHLVGSIRTDPDYFNTILSFVSVNELDNRVVIHDELSGDKLFEMYSQSDLFLFSSTFETYGIVIAEALNSGVPVFAYDSEGVRQSFGDHPVHFFNDEKSLYELLLKVMKDRDFYSSLTRNILNNENQFPTWEKVANSFIDIFKVLIKPPDI